MTRWTAAFLAGAVVTAACLGSPPAARAEEAPALVEKGAALLKKGDWTGARDAYLAAVKKDPKSLEARRGAAESLLGLGAADDAIEQANAGLDLCGNKDAGLWLLVARGYLRKGETLAPDRTDEIKQQLDDARAKAAEALKQDPSLVLARVVFSKACRMGGDSVSASAALEEGLKTAPGDFDLQFEMGMVQLKKTSYDEALKAFTAAAAADPKSGDAQFQRGVSFAFLKRWEEAVEAMGKAAVLDPQNRKALQNIGKWAKDRTIPALRAILKERPDHAWAHAYLGYYLAYGKDEAGAITEGKAAMARGPEDLDLVAWHGQIVDILGKREEAIAWYRKSLGKGRGSDLAWVKLCDIALNPAAPTKMDDRKELITFMGKIRADDGVFWNNVGLMFRDVAKDFKRSLEAYLRAAALSPNDQGIQNDTGLIYMYHGPTIGVDPRLGLPYFERCLALVKEENQAAEMGYRDTLQNLAVYYSTVDKNPEKCLEYATERNDPEFLSGLPKELNHHSPEAERAKAWAEKELKR